METPVSQHPSPSRVAARHMATTTELEDRLAEVPDLERAASGIEDTLSALKGIEDTPAMYVRVLVSALSNAVSSETAVDLDANLADAMRASQELSKALVSTRRHLESDGDLGEDDREVAVHAVRDALGDLRTLMQDIKWV